MRATANREKDIAAFNVWLKASILIRVRASDMLGGMATARGAADTNQSNDSAVGDRIVDS